ncbi:MAG: hypothetical protein IJ882_06855, partial [Paludibacteraceae bacterium]|nr:hypothetical protein [Paludibacteraceae bacterium]
VFDYIKKTQASSKTCAFSESGPPDGRQRSASGGESVEHGGALYKGRARGRASRSLSALALIPVEGLFAASTSGVPKTF